MRFRIPIVPALVALSSVLVAGQSAADEPPALKSAKKFEAIRERMRQGQEKKAEEAKQEEKKAEETKQEEKKAEQEEKKAEQEEKKVEKKAEQEEKKAEKLEEKAEKADERSEKLKARLEELRTTRPKRQQESRERLTARWGEAVEFPAFRAELRRHARRVARLNRIQELAKAEGKTKIEERADKLLTLETGRHERRLQELAKSGGAEAPGAAASADKGSTVPAAASKEGK